MIRLGHKDPLAYTPRQMAGWVVIGQARDYREQAKLLSLIQVATSRDKRAIKGRLSELRKLGGE